MYGLHFSETLGGRLFSQSLTPVGLAIPIYTATAVIGGLPIWNPPNSNVIVELVSVDINRASGTADFGAVGLMALPLAAVATGALCTRFDDTRPANGYLGGGASSKVKSTNAGTVTVVAGVATNPYADGAVAPGWVRSLACINLEADTGTAHGTGIQTYNFNGTAGVPPGNMVYLACTKASVALYANTFIWKEHLINPLVG